VKDLTATNLNLAEANQKLEQSVKLLEATNKELELSKRQLEEALKAKDLLATVSHELRNPLNIFLFLVQFLLSQFSHISIYINPLLDTVNY